MTIEKRVDLADVSGVEFRCRCGGSAEVKTNARGLACDVNDPEVKIRVLMKPLVPGGQPWTGWDLQRSDDPDIPDW